MKGSGAGSVLASRRVLPLVKLLQPVEIVATISQLSDHFRELGGADRITGGGVRQLPELSAGEFLGNYSYCIHCLLPFICWSLSQCSGDIPGLVLIPGR